MVEIKLKPIIRFADAVYPEEVYVSGLYLFDGSDYKSINFRNRLGFLNSIEAEYGLLYRWLVTAKSDGSMTAARIIGWDNANIYVGDWSNGAPQEGRPFTVTHIRAKTNFLLSEVNTEELNIGEFLMAEELTIQKQYESYRKMDLRVSRASFGFVSNDSIKEFMNKYWLSEKIGLSPFILSVHIIEDGVGRFWGCCKQDNIYYDEENMSYYIDAYDWIKYLIDTKGTNKLPHYGTPTLSKFLSENLHEFNTTIININGMNEYWDHLEYSYYTDGDQRFDLDKDMTVADMLVEALKYYSAYMYYDGNKNLIFQNRNIVGPVKDINGSVVADTLYKQYVIRDFDSILINVKQDDWQESTTGTWISSEQWALVWEEDGEIKSLIADGDLSNIPRGRKFLDLRQQLPYEQFDYRMFASITPEIVFNNYADLLVSKERYEAELVGSNYDLHDCCYFKGNWYLIKSCEINYNSGTTKVLLEKTNG